MKIHKSITSYDKVNDTFVSKLENKKGYIADFNISNGIILAMDKLNQPTFIFINNASNLFNVDKDLFDESEILISLDCDEKEIDFEIFVGYKRIYYAKTNNVFNIPEIQCIMKN